jgi:hypothetical protein
MLLGFARPTNQRSASADPWLRWRIRIAKAPDDHDRIGWPGNRH